MPKFNHRGIVIGLVAVIALLLSITVGLAKDSQKQEYDMNDRFADDGGASGSGKISVHKNSIRVKVKAEDLEPHHQYEMKLTIGPAGDFAPTNVVTCGPKTSNRRGKANFRCDIDLVQLLGPGTYRVDIFVTHIHPGGDGDLAAVLNRDPLLACQPAPQVMVPE